MDLVLSTPDHEAELDAGVYSYPDWWRAQTVAAGAMGRVAAVLAPFMALAALDHGCVGPRGDRVRGRTVDDPPHLAGCRIASAELLNPGGEGGPCLYLTVPRGDVTVWLALIGQALKAITDDAKALATFREIDNEDRSTAAGAGVSAHGISYVDDVSPSIPPTSSGPPPMNEVQQAAYTAWLQGREPA